MMYTWDTDSEFLLKVGLLNRYFIYFFKFLAVSSVSSSTFGEICAGTLTGRVPFPPENSTHCWQEY